MRAEIWIKEKDSLLNFRVAKESASSVGSVGNELIYSVAWETSGVFSGSLIGQPNYINLKQIDNQIFFQQNVLYGNSKEL